MTSQTATMTSVRSQPSAVPPRHKEGFLSGSFLPTTQAGSGNASVALSLEPASQQDGPADEVEISLSNEVLNRADLESRSVFVYGFVESDWLLPQTTLLLRMLTEKCGPVTGAFRFFKRAPAAYDRGEYASVVFLVVFDTVQAATAALRLTLERVGETLINVQPASSKRKSHAAAQRILESFLPVSRRAEVKEAKGGKRRWAPDDFSPSNRLWVVVLWGNSTYTVNWRAARAAAQRYDAVIIDDAKVMLPYTDPSLLAKEQARPGGGYWDVELYDDGYSHYRRGGDSAGNDKGDNPFGTATSDAGNRRETSRPYQQQYVERQNSFSGSPASLNSRSGSGSGDGFRSAQQRYYDMKYGRPDYSWEPYNDYYGIRGDVWRLTRYGFHCARWALHKTRGLLDGITASEDPLRIDDGGETRDGRDSSDRYRASESSPPHRGDGERRAGEAGDARRRGHSDRAATEERNRLEEEEENARVRQGGLRRRYGGVELRRPNPVEASLVWMPGVEYVRPVMNFFGFWKHDEGRNRGDDPATAFDEEDRRLSLDERGGRLVRSRYEDVAGRKNDHRPPASRSGGAATASSSPMAALAAPSVYDPTSEYALVGGEAVYPALTAPAEPNTLNDLSRLTDDNIDVRVPTRQAAARSIMAPASSSLSHRTVMPPTGDARRKRGRSRGLLGNVADSASHIASQAVSRLLGSGGDGDSGVSGRDHRDELWGGREESDPNSHSSTVRFSDANFGPVAPPDITSYERLCQSGALSSHLQNRHAATEQQQHQQPLRSSLKRGAARGTTANSTLNVNASTESMPHKRPRIRVVGVRPTPTSADISAISSIGFTDTSVAETAPRRTVNFTLPRADE